jgi:hypothetical protein
MVTIPDDADPANLKKGEAKHGSDEDIEMTTLAEVAPVPGEGQS